MKALGEMIRVRRTELGLTLEALAERARVSRAMLSDIERNMKNPTIKVLSQIAEGLKCSVSYLLSEQPEKPVDSIQIIRAGERRVLVDPRSGVERHLLAPALQHHGIEVLWYMLPSGQGTGNLPPHQPGVEEHITVVQGSLECTLGEQHILLEMGDSVFFPANVEHAFYNTDQGVCTYFLVIDASHTMQE